MKQLRPVLFLLVSVLISQSAMAQKGFKLGLVALPQNTWLINSDDWNAAKSVYNHQLTFGMAGGVMAGWNFGDGVGLRLNALYSVQGQRYSSENSKNELVENNIRLQYLRVPLMFCFNTHTEYSKVIFNFALGFEAGLLTKARYYNNDQSYVPDQSQMPNVLDYPTTKETYNKFTYGPVGEIGFDVKLTYNVMANFRLRGNYMLNDAENKNATMMLIENGIPYRQPYWKDTRPETKQITAGLMLGITYTFTEF